MDGAHSYELAVYKFPSGNERTKEATLVAGVEEAELVEWATLPGGATSWTPSMHQCLESGARYVWFIRAVSAYEPGEWSVGSQVVRGEIGSRFERAAPGSRDGAGALSEYRQDHRQYRSHGAELLELRRSCWCHPRGNSCQLERARRSSVTVNFEREKAPVRPSRGLPVPTSSKRGIEFSAFRHPVVTLRSLPTF